MSMILLAVEDADRDAPLRELLTAEGWRVTTSSSQEEAIRAAADHAPQLLIVDPSMEQADGLLQTFRSYDGGPAILLLVDDAGAAGEEASIVRGAADEEIVGRVRERLEAPREAAAAPAVPDEQLTTSELFGDILEDISGSEPPLAESTAATTEGVVAETPVEAEPDEAPVERAAAEAPVEAVEPEVEETPVDAEAETAAGEGGDPMEAEVQELVEPSDEDLAEEEAQPSDPGEIEIERQVESLLTGEPDGEWEGEADDHPDRITIHEVLAGEAAAPGEVEASAAVEEEPIEEASEEAEPEEERERFGGYELLELLEYTDATERWRARPVDGDEEAVLERPRVEVRGRANAVESFVEGFSAAAGWDDASLIKVLDLGREEGVDYVVTGPFEGRSLQEIVDRVHQVEARVPLGIGVLIAERIASGLRAIEAQGKKARHGRLVPSSVLIGDDGRVTLRDFGSRRTADELAAVELDWTQWRFIAPEDWDGDGGLKADLYALGSLIYEMLSGVPVHRADDLEALGVAVREKRIPQAEDVDPTIPSDINEWVMALLDVDPERRPSSAGKVVKAIGKSLDSLHTRPGAADIAAYLRQLFAVRVPRAATTVPESLQPDRPAAASGEGASLLEALRRWWWVVVPIAVLVGYLLFRAMAGGGGSAAIDAPEGSDRPPAIARVVATAAID